MRLNHPLLSLCYGHKLHPFDLKERLLSFMGVQLFAIPFAAVLILIIVSLQEGSNFGIDLDTAPIQLTQIEQWLLGFGLDLIFGCIISAAEFVFEFNATCECTERLGKCPRTWCKRLGHLNMLVMTAVFGYMAYFIPRDIFWTVSSEVDNSFAYDVMMVSGTTFIFGLFFAWFLIDAIIMSLHFDRLWKLQKGIKKFDKEKLNPFFNCVNPYCVTSWFCLCSGVVCYYLFCVHCILKNRILKYGYPKYDAKYGNNNITAGDTSVELNVQSESEDEGEGKGGANFNVIGSETGEFVVTWQDYFNFKHKQPVWKRDVVNVLKRMYGDEIEAYSSATSGDAFDTSGRTNGLGDDQHQNQTEMYVAS